MSKLSFLPFLFLAAFLQANTPPPAAPDFTVTTSDGQVKSLYSDYINQQKLVVIEAFFTTCPPCATHAPLVQNLYTAMQAAHPGKLEFILLSTLFSDTNVKVAQYKTSKGLTMPGVGKDGGSITALQPYLNGQYGAFEGTPTFIVIAPGSGMVFFDIRGNSPSETIALLQQKIESFFPKSCSLENPFGAQLDEVKISVDAPAFDTAFMANGSYSLTPLNSIHNSPYTVKPYKSGNSTGITTYDLVLISKHILAIEPFHCPWQILAADVNCTGSITSYDIVTIRKVILGILDSFPCGNYRFIPDSAKLSNGSCQDFIGVKLGDVNAGPCTDSLYGGIDSRSQSQQLVFFDHDFQAGETARIPLFLSENAQLDGLQFALNFDPSSFKIHSLETGTLEGLGSDSYRLSDHDLALSWLQAKGQDLPAGSALLTLEVTAPKGGRLSDLIHLAPYVLSPEVYPSTGSIRALQLGWLPPFDDFSVSPNPTTGPFTLRINAGQDGDFLLQMMDLQGRFILEKTFSAVKGLNQWLIDAPINNHGLYILKVNGKLAGKVLVSGR